ncbi:MAG: NHL repeat-containing protein [Candidatus Heimdallarchaeota archaeon]|nr:NHL repeat-containing protein [Candidatus Heimdallarchaeota archaeon]MCK5047823.1 NHL repeat-containing protein [Candidatus Heimdallarchaeota archaeon]
MIDMFQFGSGEAGVGKKEFNLPYQAIITEESYLISDRYNHRVVILDLEGKYKGQFGKTNKISEKNGMFNAPASLSSISGKLFVCDSGNDRIEVFNLDNRKYEYSIKETPTGSSSKLRNPLGIATLKDTIAVADTFGRRICFFNMKGEFLSEIKSEGEKRSNQPIACCASENSFYATIFESQKIIELSKEGEQIMEWEIKDKERELAGISFLNDKILVSDALNAEILIFNNEGELLETLGTGVEVMIFQTPRGISTTEKSLIVADKHRIIILTL